MTPQDRRIQHYIVRMLTPLLEPHCESRKEAKAKAQRFVPMAKRSDSEVDVIMELLSTDRETADRIALDLFRRVRVRLTYWGM